MSTALCYAIKGMLSEMDQEKVNIVQSRFDAFMKEGVERGEDK